MKRTEKDRVKGKNVERRLKSWQVNAGWHHSQESDWIKNLKKDATRLASAEYADPEITEAEIVEYRFKIFIQTWPEFVGSVNEGLVSISDAIDACWNTADRLAKEL